MTYAEAADTLTQHRRRNAPDARQPPGAVHASTRSATRPTPGTSDRTRGLLRRAAARTAAEGRLHDRGPGTARRAERMRAGPAPGADIIAARGHPRRARLCGPPVAARSARAPPEREPARAARRAVASRPRRSCSRSRCSAGAALRDAERAEHLARRVGHDDPRAPGLLGHALAPVRQRVDAAAVLRAGVGLDARCSARAPIAFRSLSALGGHDDDARACTLAGRRISPRVGLWAAALTAVNPAMYYYSQEARATRC